MKKLMKNKKADVPILLLVIGVVAVCAVTLLSFSIVGSRIKSNFNSVNFVEEANAEMEKYNVYKGLGFSEEELGELFDFGNDDIGRYLYFELSTGLRKKTLVSVKYYLG